MRKGVDDTAATRSPPPTRGPSDGRHINGCGVGHEPRRPRGSQPRRKRIPSYNPTTRGRATHSSNACRSGTPAGKTSTCPARATGTQKIEASLSSPWCRTRTKTQRPPPTSPGLGPRFPDPRDPPATEKGAAPNPDPLFYLTLLSREPNPRGAGQKGPAKQAGPTAGPMTTGIVSSTTIYQIRALALGKQMQPAIRTETEAQAAHAALVHEISSALCSVLERRLGNPAGP